MTKPHLNFSNWSIKCLPIWTSSTKQWTCRKKLRRKQKNAFADSWKFLVTLVTSIRIIAVTLCMVKRKHATTSFTGLFHAYKTLPAKLTLRNSWFLFRFRMNTWSMRKCEALCNVTKTCRLSSRLSIRILKHFVMKAWIQQNSRRKSPNLNRRKNNCSLRSICSRTEVTQKTSKPSSKPPQSSEKNRKTTLVSMRKSVNLPRWSKWVNISFFQSDSVSWMLKR